MGGKHIVSHATKLEGLKSIFADPEAAEKLDPETPIYYVEMQDNGIKEGEEGGLFWGISHIYPGKIGQEYFMTRGHVHQALNTGEYYVGLAGTGLLLLIDLQGSARIERVTPGSLHYIPGNTAHRLINTGDTMLSVGACWQSNSGHDYTKSVQLLTRVRVFDEGGQPVIKTASN